MADLSHTDAEWTRFLREFGFFLRIGRTAIESEDRFRRLRTQIVSEGDTVGPNLDLATAPRLTLTGIQYGQNTTENGELFVRVTSGPTFTVSLFRATGGGGGDLVAQGTGTASSTVTLTEQNSSGLSGSFRLAATAAIDTTDNHVLTVFLDWRGELSVIWPEDGTTDKDTASRSSALRLLQGIADLESAKQDLVIQALNEWGLTSEEEPEQARGREFLQTGTGTLLAEEVQVDGSGAVTRLRRGLLEELRAAMEDETTGSEQDVIERVVAAGAGVFSSNNDGLGTVASHTPEDHCPAGEWTYRCVQGEDTDNGGSETFDGDFVNARGDRRFSFSGLVIKQSFKGPEGFGPIVLLRTRTKTGDGGNANLGAASTFTETGETSANTDGGVLFWRIDTAVANPANFDISFFRSSTRVAGDLVAKVENVAAAASSVVATAKNGSNLSVIFDVGSAPVDTTEGTLDLNFFHTQNASNVPDEFRITTTLTSDGKASRTMQRLLNYQLNGEVSGSESVDDDLIAGANTFVAYVVEDN